MERGEDYAAGSGEDPEAQSWWLPPCQVPQSNCAWLSSQQCRAGWRLRKGRARFPSGACFPLLEPVAFRMVMH